MRHGIGASKGYQLELDLALWLTEMERCAECDCWKLNSRVQRHESSSLRIKSLAALVGILYWGSRRRVLSPGSVFARLFPSVFLLDRVALQPRG